MTVTVNGVLYTPAYSFVAANALAASLYHIGYVYGSATNFSFSCGDNVGNSYATEDTGNWPAQFLYGGAANSNTRAKFGSTSVYLPTTGWAALPLPNVAIGQYADFTFEMWAYFDTRGGSTFVDFSGIGMGVAAGHGLGMVFSSPNYVLTWSAGVTTQGTHNLSASTWHHIAVSRSGSVTKVFLDGVQDIAVVDLYAHTISKVYAYPSAVQFYIDSVGFSNSLGYYTQNFQVPTMPFYNPPTSGGAIISDNAQFLPSTAAGTYLTPTEYDAQYRYVSLLIRGDGVVGTSNFTDARGKTFWTYGTPLISDQNTKFAQSNMYFDGASLIATTSMSDFAFQYGDFTIEFWCNPTSWGHDIIGWGNTTTSSGWRFQIDATGHFFFSFGTTPTNGNTTTSLTSSAAYATHNWHFVALSWTGGTLRLFVNGVLAASTTTIRAMPRYAVRPNYNGDEDCAYLIGGCQDTYNGWIPSFVGYMEDIRFTNGYSRYQTDTSGYVPTRNFIATGATQDGDPYWSQTVALTHFNDRDGTAYNIRDAKGNAVSLNGNSLIATAIHSIGTGYQATTLWGDSYISASLAYGSQFDFSSGDFTIECWSDSAASTQGQLLHMWNTTTGQGWKLTVHGNNTDSGEVGLGYVQWTQVDSNNIQDIAISPLNCLRQRGWQHYAVTRQGNVLTVWVDGFGGTPLTTTRRPVNTSGSFNVAYLQGTGDSYAIIQAGLNELRVTRASRYNANFIPPFGKMPETLYQFGNAIITETYSLVPAQPKSRANVPGAVITETMHLVIPNVVAPTIGFRTGMNVASTPKGGEGCRNNTGIHEQYVFRNAFTEHHTLLYADTAVAQSVAGAAASVGFHCTVGVALGNVITADTLVLGDAYAGMNTAALAVSSNTGLHVDAATALSTALANGLGFHVAQLVSRHVMQGDTLNVVEGLAPAFKFYNITIEGLGVGDLSDYRKGASLTEAYTYHGDTLPNRRAGLSIASVLGMHVDGTPTLYIQLLVNDTLNFVEGLTPAQHLAAIVGDRLNITSFLTSPVNTTWVMNTRSAAITKYEDFSFNSFVPYGERNLGAGDTGLYWIDGDDDTGVPIVATVVTPVVQPYGNVMAHVTSAYLGMRGNGQFIVTIIDEAGNSYDYTLDVNSMKTGRVTFGKGLRTRYFTFKLVSDGQDFDLDNIEFATSETTRKIQR